MPFSLLRPWPPSFKIAVLLGLVVLLAPPVAEAERTTWIADSGQWDSAENWSDGQPTASGTVTINNGSTISTPSSVTGNFTSLRVGIQTGEQGYLTSMAGGSREWKRIWVMTRAELAARR